MVKEEVSTNIVIVTNADPSRTCEKTWNLMWCVTNFNATPTTFKQPLPWQKERSGIKGSADTGLVIPTSENDSRKNFGRVIYPVSICLIFNTFRQWSLRISSHPPFSSWEAQLLENFSGEKYGQPLKTKIFHTALNLLQVFHSNWLGLFLFGTVEISGSMLGLIYFI